MPKRDFYEKKGPFPLKEIVKAIGSNDSFSHENNCEIRGLESLDAANNNDIT